MLPRLSAQLHDTVDHAAIDATFFDRETASKHYYRRTNYRVQTLKATALVDTASQTVLDVHCTTEKRHDTQVDWQLALRNASGIASLAADKGYEAITREIAQRRRETADQAPRVSTHRLRA